MATFGLSQASAQLDDEDYGFFNHVSAGVSVGTDGIGFQVAAPMTYHFAVRAGFSFMPRFKYSKSLNLGNNDIGAFLTDKVDLEGKLKMSSFSLLFDYYPFTSSSFRVTAGAYIGNGDIVSVTNTNDFINPSYAGKAGINLSRSGSTIQEKYVLITDANGNIQAETKVNGFRPYLGIGFGRAVPRKRIGVSGDLGVMFWGKPKLYEKQTGRDLEVTKSDLGSDSDKYFDIMSKITVYPVLTIRISGRIF
jgi:hypothetical protein